MLREDKRTTTRTSTRISRKRSAVILQTLESLERRLLLAGDTVPPTASLGALSTPHFGETSYTFTVNYADNVGIKTSTFDNADIRVAAPQLFSTVAEFVSAQGNTATYRFTPPGGSWDSEDNGSYSLTIAQNQVTDLDGNPVARSVLGILSVSVTDPADSVPPTASLGSAPILTFGQPTFSVSVLYADNIDIKDTTVDINDLRITGLNGYSSTPVTKFLGVDGVAQYEFDAPGGSWNSADNGTYTVSIQPNQVTDLAGNPVAAGALGTFTVNLNDQDVTPPTLTLGTLPTPVLGDTLYTFTVTYADNVAVNLQSLGDDDFTVAHSGVINGPQPIPVTFVSVTGNVATYSFVPPGGAWDPGDNGAYDITLNDNAVFDSSGNAAASQVAGTFTVNVSAPDVTPPTALVDTLVPADFGQSTYRFTVVYTDDGLFNASTIGTGDVTVAGPGGFTATPTLVSAGSSSATYEFVPPGGAWDATDNGAYVLSLLPGAVADESGNLAVGGELGTLTVNITDPVNPDDLPPIANLSPLPPAVAGQTLYSFTVTYSDDVAVNFGTIGTGDIRVDGPAGFTTLAEFVGQDNGVANYQFVPPGGSWDETDNATYGFTLLDNEIADTSGNFAFGRSLGSLPVDVSTPDVTFPTATLGTLAVPANGQTSYQFTVTYSDDVGISAGTVGTSDVKVTGPGAFSATPSFVSFDNGVATYQFTPPGGQWDPGDNGDYLISLAANEVSDTSGNSVQPGVLGTLSVNVVAPDNSLLVEHGVADNTRPDLVISKLKLGSVKKIHNSIVGGTVIKGTITVQNLGTGMATGSTTAALYLSSDATPSTGDITLPSVQISGLKLKKKASKSFNFTVTIPNAAQGNLDLVAFLNGEGAFPETTTLNNAVASTALPFARPFTNFSATKLKSGAVKAGKPATATVVITNTANQLFTGSLPGTLSYVRNGVTTPLLNSSFPVKINADGKATLKLKYTVPAGATGSDGQLVFNLDPQATLGETVTADNTSQVNLVVKS